jgi:hypothetical protein
MKKIYIFVIALSLAWTVGAQTTTINISKVNEAFRTVFDGDTVIDVATAVSAVATPSIYFKNPFYGKSFDSAAISFDIYNYTNTDSFHVLGALFAIKGTVDDTAGRLYFSNGCYLGYNAEGGYYDADLSAYAIDSNFFSIATWQHVDIKFLPKGFALYVDNVLAYDQSSTDVTIAGTVTDYGNVISFLEGADSLVIGTGSWWSDNYGSTGVYYDAQYSYLKNIQFRRNITALITSVSPTISAGEGTLVSEEYFNIGGVNVGSSYSALIPGIYIKRALYTDGTIKNTKIVKAIRQ